MSTTLHWNGRDLPDELRALPEGRYVVQAVDNEPELTPEQEAGVVAAMAALDAGAGVPADVVLRRLAHRLV